MIKKADWASFNPVTIPFMHSSPQFPDPGNFFPKIWLRRRFFDTFLLSLFDFLLLHRNDKIKQTCSGKSEFVLQTKSKNLSEKYFCFLVTLPFCFLLVYLLCFSQIYFVLWFSGPEVCIHFFFFHMEMNLLTWILDFILFYFLWFSYVLALYFFTQLYFNELFRVTEIVSWFLYIYIYIFFFLPIYK